MPQTNKLFLKYLHDLLAVAYDKSLDKEMYIFMRTELQNYLKTV